MAQNNYFNVFQSGFETNYSTETALTEWYLCEKLPIQNFSLNVNGGLSAAFNTFQHTAEQIWKMIGSTLCQLLIINLSLGTPLMKFPKSLSLYFFNLTSVCSHWLRLRSFVTSPTIIMQMMLLPLSPLLYRSVCPSVCVLCLLLLTVKNIVRIKGFLIEQNVKVVVLLFSTGWTIIMRVSRFW